MYKPWWNKASLSLRWVLVNFRKPGNLTVCGTFLKLCVVKVWNSRTWDEITQTWSAYASLSLGCTCKFCTLGVYMYAYISLPMPYFLSIVCKFNGVHDCVCRVKMFLVSDRCTSLTSLLVLLAWSAHVCSQAPGDAQGNSCEKKTVPDGVVRLLDSRWYRQLLSGGSQNAGWTQTPSGSVSE